MLTMGATPAAVPERLMLLADPWAEIPGRWEDEKNSGSRLVRTQSKQPPAVVQAHVGQIAGSGNRIVAGGWSSRYNCGLRPFGFSVGMKPQSSALAEILSPQEDTP